jgi:hypothetical protein
MTRQEFLTENNDLLIEAVYCKINRLEQKQRWSAKNEIDHPRVVHRADKLKQLAILLEWLENGN